METITVYESTYEELRVKVMDLMLENSTLKGTINALAGMEDNTDFVMMKLKELKDE